MRITVRIGEKKKEYPMGSFVELLHSRSFSDQTEFYEDSSGKWRPVYSYLEDKAFIPDVWFSSEAKNRDKNKMVVYNSIGTLEINPDDIIFWKTKDGVSVKELVPIDLPETVGSIEFKSKSDEKCESISISKVSDVGLTCGAPPIFNYLIGNVSVVIFFLMVFGIVPLVFLGKSDLAMEMLPVALFIAFGSLLVINFLIFLLWLNQKFVRIEYTVGERNKVAFFSDGANIGWSGIFGGTKHMYRQILQHINQVRKAEQGSGDNAEPSAPRSTP